jgi:hypothetical protein
MIVARILAIELLALGIAVWHPPVAVPVVALGCFAAGFVADPPDSSHRDHRARFRVLVALHAAGIAGAWLALDHAVDPLQRVAIAPVLGGMLGGAAAGLALIGMDARRHTRGAQPD